MADYLEYTIVTREPVRIADDSTSQSGQTMTLRYIPGSTVRGIIVNTLAKEPDFADIRRRLFSSEVRYLGAFPARSADSGETPLLPSAKGFYEDKAETLLRNIVTEGGFDDALKRAKLGSFMRMDGDCMVYSKVPAGSDLKILSNVEKQTDRNVFRNEYILPGAVFKGYIRTEDSGLQSRIAGVLTGTVLVGNARSAGYGKCDVSCRPFAGLPYAVYARDTDAEGECFLYLLSPTVMRGENGELCGLDLPALQEKMGVRDLKILACSTDTLRVSGYNRTWGGKTASAVMYDAGSIFRLGFTGTLTAEKMRKISDDGLGIRTGEGFGRVLFFKGLELMKRKREEKLWQGRTKTISPGEEAAAAARALDRQKYDALRVIAKSYYRQRITEAMEAYILDHPLEKGTESRSRLGSIEAYASAYRYAPYTARELIMAYYRHAQDKEDRQRVARETASMREIRLYVEELLANETRLEAFLGLATQDAGTLMGIPKADLLPPEEELGMKLDLLVRQIRFDNKGVE